MQKIERAAEYAEYLLESAQQRPNKLLGEKSGTSKWKSLHQKLIDLYVEESTKELHCKNLKSTSHLLAKLVKKDHLNTMVINLYPSNEGYSLTIRGRNGADTETIKLPYEESELLEYVDAEELPPVLVDLLDKSQANVFYNGCVIVEVRDYRRTTTNTYHSRYVLLKPTPHTMLCDINAMTNDGHRWTQEDKFNLESQLLLATQEPLCLDPSPTVFFIANKLNYEKYKFNTYALKKSVKKYSQTAVNRKRKWAQCNAPPHLRLHDFVTKRRDKLKNPPAVNLKCVDMWRQRDIEPEAPDSVEVDKYARVLEKPKLTLDNSPVTVEELTLETDQGQGRGSFAKLLIQQRMTDEFYQGELYMDRNYMEGQPKGSTCKFPLGTRANVDKYIRQFKEIFTEDCLRQVKMTRVIPGHPPVVTYTQQTSSASTSSSSHSHSQTSTTSSHQGDSSHGSGSHKPVKLSLQPSNPGSSSLVSPQGTPAQSPVALNAPSQLSLNLQQQQMTAQRLRHMYSDSQRSGGNTSSPVSTPTGGPPQLPSYRQATAAMVGSATANQKVPTPTPTPPPPLTPTSSAGSRRSSATESITGQVTILGQVHPGSAPSTPSTPTAGDTTPSGQLPGTITVTNQQAVGGPAPPGLAAPNINITNIASLPPNINIQNLAGLQGMGITNLQGLQNLQNVQVSLSGVTVPGGIAVPVPLSMINSHSTLGSTPTGILVSSLPGVQTVSSVANTPSSSTASNTIGAQAAAPSTLVTSPTALVTMVTTIPPTTSAPTTSAASNAGTPVAVTTTSILTTPTSVLANTNIMSLPIGMTGNLTQFMTAANLKGQGIRPGTPLSLLQIPGQQPIQLLSTNLPQPRGTITTSSSVSLPQQKPQVVTSPSVTTVTSLPLGGIAASGQTLMQLTPQHQLAQLAYQKQQLQQQMHLQQLKQQQASSQSRGSKSKKRATPTPPKT